MASMAVKAGSVKYWLWGLVVALVMALAAPALAEGPKGIDWLTYDEALAKQKTDAKPIMIFFHLPYCSRCQKMERITYSDPAVKKKLNQDFLPVVINLDKAKSLGESYKVDYIPTHVFLSPQGKEVLRQKDVIGLDRFLKMLNYVSSGAYQKTGFDAYAVGQ